jgi:hypothetical protein
VSAFLYAWRGPLTATRHCGYSLFSPIRYYKYWLLLLYFAYRSLITGDGGETVFTEGWPPGDGDRVEFDEAQAALRKSGDTAGILKEGSWEENMVVRCRSRLSIRPHSSRAVLFYSQNPDGTPDQKSMHGGCPVISGQKWAASKWRIGLNSSMHFSFQMSRVTFLSYHSSHVVRSLGMEWSKRGIPW